MATRHGHGREVFDDFLNIAVHDEAILWDREGEPIEKHIRTYFFRKDDNPPSATSFIRYHMRTYTEKLDQQERHVFEIRGYAFRNECGLWKRTCKQPGKGGDCLLKGHTNYRDTADSQEVEVTLRYIFVKRGLRRHGVGRKMFEIFIEKVSDTGVGQVKISPATCIEFWTKINVEIERDVLTVGGLGPAEGTYVIRRRAEPVVQITSEMLEEFSAGDRSTTTPSTAAMSDQYPRYF